MKRQALENLRSAIEANTEKKSLDDLKKAGKRHVRIVSGDKVMQIIKAVVADIIDREVGDISKRDREKIENATKTEFDRVLKLQAEQDGLLQQQKEIADDYRAKTKRLSISVKEAEARISEQRDEVMKRELELERLRAERDTLTQRSGEDRSRMAGAEDALRKAELEVERLRGEQSSTSERAKTRSKKLDELQEQIVAREVENKRLQGEIETLVRRAEEDSKRQGESGSALEAKNAEITQLRDEREARLRDEADAREAAVEEVQKRQLEIERLRGERDVLAAELAEVREAAKDSEAVSGFRNELADMRSFLDAMEGRAASQDKASVADLMAKMEEQKGAEAAAMEQMLAKMNEQKEANSEGMQERFAGQLDDALDKITKTMKAATASPIDIVVEATDVLVDKLFDIEETQASTNLDTIEVQQSKAKSGISRNLDALKKMRAGAEGKADPEPEAKKKAPKKAEKTKESAPKETKDDARTPAGEETSVSATQKKRVSSSVDRLKAVRGGAGKDKK